MNIAWNKRIMTGMPLLATTLVLGGCAGISERTQPDLGSPRLTPVSPGSVQILATEPRRPKIVLGEIILSISGNPPGQKLENKLKEAAARFGADGVFIASDQTHITPIEYWNYWGPGFDDDWNRIIAGVAFKNK
jgi:hypothetical protein